jgi:hypothetical protein
MFLIVALTAGVRFILAYYVGVQVADLGGYHLYGRMVLHEGISPYASMATLCPYPPFWLAVPVSTLWASEYFGVRFDLLMRCWSIAADALTAAVLWRWTGGDKLWVLAGWVFNPVSLMITGLQGNFMPVAVACAATAAYLSDRKQNVASALVLGVGIGLRSWPVLLIPFLVRKMKWRAIEHYVVCAAAPVVISVGVYAIVAPDTFYSMIQQVSTYRGVVDASWIGIARAWWFLHTTMHQLPGIFEQYYTQKSANIFLVVAAMWGLFSWCRPQFLSTAGWCASILLLDLLIVGGIGMQYLIWPLPFLVAYRARKQMYYSLWASLFIITFCLQYFRPLLLGRLDPAMISPWTRVEMVGAMGICLAMMYLSEIYVLGHILLKRSDEKK